MRIKTAPNQNQNRKLVAIRLRELDISFLLTLIDWNERSGEYLGNKDRWEFKRAHVKRELESLIELPGGTVDPNPCS